jgi:hypothetical protein
MAEKRITSDVNKMTKGKFMGSVLKDINAAMSPSTPASFNQTLTKAESRAIEERLKAESGTVEERRKEQEERRNEHAKMLQKIKREYLPSAKKMFKEKAKYDEAAKKYKEDHARLNNELEDLIGEERRGLNEEELERKEQLIRSINELDSQFLPKKNLYKQILDETKPKLKGWSPEEIAKMTMFYSDPSNAARSTNAQSSASAARSSEGSEELLSEEMLSEGNSFDELDVDDLAANWESMKFNPDSSLSMGMRFSSDEKGGRAKTKRNKKNNKRKTLRKKKHSKTNKKQFRKGKAKKQSKRRKN